MRYPSRKSPIACHAEAVREGRSILLCWFRSRRGALSFAWRFPRLCRSSVTNSTDFLLLFGGGRIALATLLAFLTQLLLVQISLELFIGKTTAETLVGLRINPLWDPLRKDPRFHKLVAQNSISLQPRRCGYRRRSRSRLAR